MERLFKTSETGCRSECYIFLSTEFVAFETTRNEEDPATDKYGLLVNFLGSEVYAYIEETTNCDSDLVHLKKAYIKTKKYSNGSPLALDSKPTSC